MYRPQSGRRTPVAGPTENEVFAYLGVQTRGDVALELFRTDGAWRANEGNCWQQTDHNVGIEDRQIGSTDESVVQGGAGKKLSGHLPHDNLTGLRNGRAVS